MHKLDEGYKSKYNHEEMTRMFNECTNNTFKCKCGHSILITNREKKKVCSYCGRLVFRSKRDEYFYRLKEML